MREDNDDEDDYHLNMMIIMTMIRSSPYLVDLPPTGVSKGGILTATYSFAQVPDQSLTIIIMTILMMMILATPMMMMLMLIKYLMIFSTGGKML